MMETFATACLAVGLAVVFYVGRMGRRQRRLQQMLEALEARAREQPNDYQQSARSA